MVWCLRNTHFSIHGCQWLNVGGCQHHLLQLIGVFCSVLEVFGLSCGGVLFGQGVADEISLPRCVGLGVRQVLWGFVEFGRCEVEGLVWCGLLVWKTHIQVKDSEEVMKWKVE